MKRQIITIAISFLLGLAAQKSNAQITNNWAKTASALNETGNSSYDYGFTDNVMSVLDTTAKLMYVAGNFNGKVDFNPGTGKKYLTGKPTSDYEAAYLAAYSITNGSYVWANGIGVLNASTKYSLDVICSKQKGNGFFIAGRVQGKIKIGNTVISSTSSSKTDYFIAKLSASGAVEKTIVIADNGTPANTKTNAVSQLETDLYGNIYIACSYKGKKDFNPLTPQLNVNTSYSTDVVLARFDEQLKIVWANKIETHNNELRIDALSIDKLKNIILSGTYEDSNLSTGLDIDFKTGAGVKNLPDMNSDAAANGFVGKYDATGKLSWVKNIRMVDTENGSDGVTFTVLNSVNTYGDVFVAGSLVGEVIFDLVATQQVSISENEYGFFLSKFTHNGVYKFAKVFGESVAHVSDLVVDKNSAYVATTTHDMLIEAPIDAELYKIKIASTGFPNYSKQLISNDDASDIHCSFKSVNVYKNSLYVSGSFNCYESSPYNFGAYQHSSISPESGNDLFIAKYTYSGSALSPEEEPEQGNNMAYKTAFEENTTNILVYPNPAKEELSIKITLSENETAAATVYDYNGVAVKSIAITDTETKINIADLPAGRYFVEVVSNGVKEVKKIVKQ